MAVEAVKQNYRQCKWRCNACALKGSFGREKQILTWNPQGQCTGGRLRRSWRRMIEEEDGIVLKTCRQVRAIDENGPLALLH
jgi:predicted metal-binding protein